MCACICKCASVWTCLASCHTWHTTKSRACTQRHRAPQLLLLSSKPWPVQSPPFITTWQTSWHSLQDFWKTSCQPKAAKPASHIILISTHRIMRSWKQNPDTMQKNIKGFDKEEKENLAFQQFSLYQETRCSAINGPSLKALVWITRDRDKEDKIKQCWTSLVPLYPLMRL